MTPQERRHRIDVDVYITAIDQETAKKKIEDALFDHAGGVTDVVYGLEYDEDEED